MKIAILTGASSGVGKEFFDALCEKYNYLDEVWVVARRAQRLEKLKEGAPFEVRTISVDLTEHKGIEAINSLLKNEKPDVEILINNAGFGKLGYIDEIPYTEHIDMVNLNNAALTALCCLCVPYMKQGAFIVNVASIAAFAPNPRMATYCSTKAYVLHFSKCLREELKKRRINVLAVCPGPMATEFLDIAGISGGKSKTFETLPYCNPRDVAFKALKKAQKGKGVYTPRTFFKFYRLLAKIAPHNIIMKFSKT